jgi:Fe2+ transport system protein FeoA
MRRKLLALGALAGLAFVLTRGRGKERVDVFFEDGSRVTLGDGDAKPLLEIARSIL